MMYFWCCTRQKALSVKSDKVLNIYICVIWICLEFRISNYRITAYATISYHQSSVFCLLSTAFGTLYICREFSTNRPFYAKQTQFTKCPNLHKFLLYKGLSKFYPAGGAKKQTQFKPNQTQFQKSQNEYKLNFNKGLQKKR